MARKAKEIEEEVSFGFEEDEVEEVVVEETPAEEVQEREEVVQQLYEALVELSGNWTAELREDGYYNVFDHKHVLQVVGVAPENLEQYT